MTKGECAGSSLNTNLTLTMNGSVYQSVLSFEANYEMNGSVVQCTISTNGGELEVIGNDTLLIGGK